MGNILVKQGKEIGGIVGSLAGGGATITELEWGSAKDYVNDFNWISFQPPIKDYDLVILSIGYPQEGTWYLNEETQPAYPSATFILPVHDPDFTDSIKRFSAACVLPPNDQTYTDSRFIDLNMQYDAQGDIVYGEFSSHGDVTIESGRYPTPRLILGVKLGSASGGSSIEISTAEHPVGKIGDDTLYSKMFIFTSGSSYFTTSFPNVKRIYGSMCSDGKASGASMGTSVRYPDRISAIDDTLEIVFSSESANIYPDYPLTVVVFYTKTS